LSVVLIDGGIGACAAAICGSARMAKAMAGTKI
jgi:hypothetical protein